MSREKGGLRSVDEAARRRGSAAVQLIGRGAQFEERFRQLAMPHCISHKEALDGKSVGKDDFVAVEQKIEASDRSRSFSKPDTRLTDKKTRPHEDFRFSKALFHAAS